MGMDLCYYGIKEEEIPKILDENFDVDFSKLEPSYTTRVFSAKDFYYLYTGGKELEEVDFQGKNERDIFTEALLGEVTVSFAPEDIYSYCSCKEKVKEIANFLNKIDIKDYLSPQAISELNAVGGVLVLAIGINMTFKKDIKTANMLPAIFIPLLVSIFS